MNLQSGLGKSKRFHSLDSLRAGMMFLGIVLHGALPYTGSRAWPFTDRLEKPIIFDALVFAIHLFRMPLFFVLAGFFASLLYKRLGVRDFLWHRAKRILLPFAIGWLVLYVPTTIGVQYGIHWRSPHPWLEVANFFVSGLFISESYTMHLWFLYYLYCFYLLSAIALVAAPFLLGRRLQAGIKTFFRTTASSRWRPLIFAVPTCWLLYFSPVGSFGSPSDWLPQVIDLTTYGLFFVSGWLLYAETDLLRCFQDDAWIHLGFAAALIPLALKYLMEETHASPKYEPRAHTILIMLSGLICWLLIFGLIGLSSRYLDTNSERIRYIADASYWVYLVHYPIVIWLQVVLLPLNMPIAIKFFVVVAGTTVLTMASYHVFVRYTLIGRLLNGVRYRSGAPEVAKGAAN